MSKEMYALLSTFGGATIGLLAPLVSTRLGGREVRLNHQKEVADQILQMFEVPDDPIAQLRQSVSPIRRRLFLLASRLDSDHARLSCMRVIDAAARKSDDDGAVEDAWFDMMSDVGAVYRRKRPRTSHGRG